MKPIAIVLGGTAPHIALIKKLQKRGYYVVLFDYLENPPAATIADQHIRVSTLDLEAVLKVSKDLNPSLVISACIDQANATACYVAEKLNLPKPYSYQNALNVTKKYLMKSIMAKNGVPTSKYVKVTKLDDFKNADLRYPLVVKPSDSNGSLGVHKINGENDLLKHFSDSLSISRDGSVIIEEFIEGKEVSVDCYIGANEATILLIREKIKIPLDDNDVLQSPGSFSPASISDIAAKRLHEIAVSISQAFELKNTPLLIQAIVSGDKVNVIEFAPRIGGGLSFRTVFLSTGFDLIEAAIDSFIGHTHALKYTQPSIFLATIILYGKPGVFSHVEGLTELYHDGTIQEYHQYKTPKMVVGSNMTTKSRIGAIIICSKNRTELLEKIKTAASKFKAYDINNNNIFNSDIYSRIYL